MNDFLLASVAFQTVIGSVLHSQILFVSFFSIPWLFDGRENGYLIKQFGLIKAMLSLDMIELLFINGHNLGSHDSPLLNRIDAYRWNRVNFSLLNMGVRKKGVGSSLSHR